MSDETPQTEIPTEAQSELFPKSKVDFANEFLEHFQADVEAAEKSLVNARTKLRVAVVLRDDAEENLRRALAEEAGTVDGQADDEDDSSRQIEDAPKQIGAPVEDAEWTEEVDPITGEVADQPVQTTAERPCPDCHGDGRLPDRTGGGHHRCRTCDGTGTVEGPPEHVVIVLYPGDEEPHVTVIGDKTRYAELVADYFTAAGIDSEVDADEWQVLAEDELTMNGGGGRSLTAPIQERDYGHRLIVAAADQGSACGLVDESAA